MGMKPYLAVVRRVPRERFIKFGFYDGSSRRCVPFISLGSERRDALADCGRYVNIRYKHHGIVCVGIDDNMEMYPYVMPAHEFTPRNLIIPSHLICEEGQIFNISERQLALCPTGDKILVRLELGDDVTGKVHALIESQMKKLEEERHRLLETR